LVVYEELERGIEREREREREKKYYYYNKTPRHIP
jgi:hypothetical protein